MRARLPERGADRSDANDGKPVGQIVTFGVGDQCYGLDITAVREIRSWSTPTELPGGAPAARGVLDIRGNIVEVFDLSVMLGRPAIGMGQGQVVLVVSAADGDVGIVVETVSDIVTVRDGDIREPPNTYGDPERAKIAGLFHRDDRLIAVLDAAALAPRGAEQWLLD